MDVALQTQTFTGYEPVFSDTQTLETAGEMIVPDKMPDIGRIADADGVVLLRSKEAEDGKLRLQGEVQVSVLYLPDGAAGFRALHFALPLEVLAESEEISHSCVPTAELTLAGVEARVLNPRKILVRAEVQAETACYGFTTYSYSADVEKSPEAPIQLRQTREKISVIPSVCERTFVVTDEIALSGAAADGEIVSRRAQFRMDDVKTVGNKMILKGSVVSDVAYLNSAFRLESVSFTTPFSQIMEMDSEEITPNAQFRVMATGLYYELNHGESGDRLTMELHAVCQTAALSMREVSYIADAYSNAYPCAPEYRTDRVRLDTHTETLRETLRETMGGKSDVESVQLAACRVRDCTVRTDGVYIRLELKLCVQYAAGVSDCLSKTVEVQFAAGETDGERVPERVRCLDLHTVLSGGGVEVRLTVEADLRTTRWGTLRSLTGLTLDEEQLSCQNRPSLTVIQSGGALWDLARKYGSTVELIRAWNDSEGDFAPSGEVLLIPRERF